MAIDKSLLTGSTTMLILNLVSDKDMYGYEMIEELSNKSNNCFQLKAGTLYPILHSLEEKGMLTSYNKNADSARIRKYYSITKKGKTFLKQKKSEWKEYTTAVNQVIKGGASIESTY